MLDSIAKTSHFLLSWFITVVREYFMPSQRSFKIHFKFICYTQRYTM